jgi:hypothetical protein
MATTETEQLLQRFLELQVRDLESRQAAEAEARRRDEVKAEVGQMITYLVLLLAYGLVLGLVSQSRIVQALMDPQKVSQVFQTTGTAGTEILNAVPDPLRGLFISTLTTVVLLFVRGGSNSVRADLGGALFMGGVVLSLVGVAGAAVLGTAGALAAVAGLAAAAVIVYQLCELLVRLRPSGLETETVARSRIMSQLRSSMALVAREIDPRRSLWLRGVYLAVPVACGAIATVSVFVTGGGPLYTPTLLSYYAIGVWAAWACVVTPAAVRIPIWSLLPWSLLVGNVFGFDSLTVILGLSVLGLLFVSSVVFTLRPPAVSSGLRS